MSKEDQDTTEMVARRVRLVREKKDAKNKKAREKRAKLRALRDGASIATNEPTSKGKDSKKIIPQCSKKGCGITERSFLRHLVDVVWREAKESSEVPATDWADRVIARAKETFDRKDDPEVERPETIYLTLYGPHGLDDMDAEGVSVKEHATRDEAEKEIKSWIPDFELAEEDKQDPELRLYRVQRIPLKIETVTTATVRYMDKEKRS